MAEYAEQGLRSPVFYGGLPWLAAALAVCSFAATFPVTRAMLVHLSPWTIGTGRVLIAGVLAAIVLVVLRVPVPPRSSWLALLIASLGVAVGFPLLSALALVDIAASSAGAQAAALPLLTAVVAVVFAGERPLARFWCASVLGTSAVIIYAVWESGFSWRTGNDLLFGALLSAAFGYVAGARASAALPAWQATCWFTLIAMPVNLLLLLCFAPAVPGQLAQLDAMPWLGLGLLHLALFSQLIGFIAWNYALARGGIARVGQVQLLQPFVTLALASLWLGEMISPFMLVTVVAVLLSLVAANKARSRQTRL